MRTRRAAISHSAQARADCTRRRIRWHKALPCASERSSDAGELRRTHHSAPLPRRKLYGERQRALPSATTLCSPTGHAATNTPSCAPARVCFRVVGQFPDGRRCGQSAGTQILRRQAGVLRSAASGVPAARDEIAELTTPSGHGTEAGCPAL
jgi:hypothetical protein